MLLVRRTRVHPAGAVMVAVFDRKPTDAIITSLTAVPAGTGSVSDSTPLAEVPLDAARNEMPEMLLNASLVRPSVQRISAFGTSPRLCGIACDAGAAPGALVKLPT